MVETPGLNPSKVTIDGTVIDNFHLNKTTDHTCLWSDSYMSEHLLHSQKPPTSGCHSNIRYLPWSRANEHTRQPGGLSTSETWLTTCLHSECDWVNTRGLWYYSSWLKRLSIDSDQNTSTSSGVHLSYQIQRRSPRYKVGLRYKA